MKTFAEVEELLSSERNGGGSADSNGSGGSRGEAASAMRPNGAAIIELPHIDESPMSTVTEQAGKLFLNRVKPPSPLTKQMSWMSSSNGTHRYQPTDATTTITSVQKFAMKQTKIFPGRIRKRVVLKNGIVNLSKERIEKRHQRYLQDTFTTMVDIQWRWNLLVFALGFILSWLGFAIVWWIICYAHGDFENAGQENWTPCVVEVTSFASAFLFSIETQHTIGYGSRSTTEECPEAIFVMCLQSITGVMIQCYMVGFVFAKLSRPQKRSQTLLFSRNAIICLRDNKLCLMFRLGDVRNRSHIIGPSISAIVISRKTTSEGEVLPYYQTQIECKFDNSSDNIFFVWPATMVHVIDENSPFYNMNAEELSREKFEIVVLLEGTVESTGQSVQARSSYLPSEILWGHRFEQLIRYKKETGEYCVDYSKFNNTYEVDSPTCSAKDLYEYQRYVMTQNSPLPRISPSDFYSSTSKNDDKNSDSGVSNNATNNGLTVRSLTISQRQASSRSAINVE